MTVSPLTLVCVCSCEEGQPDWEGLAVSLGYEVAVVTVRDGAGLQDQVGQLREGLAGVSGRYALAVWGEDAYAALVMLDGVEKAREVGPELLLMVAPVVSEFGDRVGVLRVPALVCAVEGDPECGAATLDARLMPHLAHGALMTFQGPAVGLIERAGEEIAAAWGGLARDEGVAVGPEVDPAFRALLASDHVSGRTRGILERRGAADAAFYQPRALTAGAFAILRAAVARVLPQEEVLEVPIDLAARIDTRLATRGDGWRFAELPPDAEAFEAALRTLDRAAVAMKGAPFVVLDGAAQDDLFRAIGDGSIRGEGLSAKQMGLWFTDLRADCVQAFLVHPAVMGRLGIESVANGGDGVFQGFGRVGPDEREDWELDVAAGEMVR